MVSFMNDLAQMLANVFYKNSVHHLSFECHSLLPNSELSLFCSLVEQKQPPTHK